eukprot:g20770.t1
MQIFIPDLVGNGVEPWMVVVEMATQTMGPPVRRLQPGGSSGSSGSSSTELTFTYEIYLVPELVSTDLSRDSVRETLQAADTTEAGDLLTQSLADQGVPVDTIGMEISELVKAGPGTAPSPSDTMTTAMTTPGGYSWVLPSTTP